LRIDSWEGNSVRQPFTPLPPFLKEAALDFSCFQELKCDDAAFPRLEVEDAGYDVGLHGQKAFNGVAILSRHRNEHLIIGVPRFRWGGPVALP
jgi:exodeoxyribonuclease III